MTFANHDHHQSHHSYKIIEIVGSSELSSDDAIRSAIRDAGASVKHLEWFEVIDQRGHIRNGEVAHFQVVLKIGFRVEK